MDTVTEFFLSDATISGIQVALWFIGALFLLPSLIALLALLDEAGAARICLAIASFGLALVVLGSVINHNEHSEIKQSTQDVVHEIEDEYGIKIYSTSLHDTLKDAAIDRPENNTSFNLDAVLYIYEGTVYTTPMSIMYTNGRDGASISLFSPASAEAVEMVPFSPTTGEVHTEPLEELESSSE